MQTMRNLVKEGKSIIFISHKLNEIMAIADRCTVLWHGKSVGTVELRDPKITKEYLSELMVGRKVTLVPDKPEQKLGQEILTVKELSVIDKRTEKIGCQ